MPPDKQTVADLKAMSIPKNKPEIQSLLGLITFLSPFINNLAAQAEHIRILLGKDVPFEWSEDHQYVFEHLKTLVSTDVGLK